MRSQLMPPFVDYYSILLRRAQMFMSYMLNNFRICIDTSRQKMYIYYVPRKHFSEEGRMEENER